MKARLLAAGALAVIGVLKIADELRRLTISTAPNGAIDVGLRFQEVQRWFSGVPVYDAVPWIAYPPQAYIVLWPFLGWLDFGSARWLWALTSLAALAGLAAVMGRASGAATPAERVLVVAAVLSMNAVGVTIGNGQLGIHLLLATLTGIVLIARVRQSITMDLIGAMLIVAALAKPTLAAPFMWVVLAATARWRPIFIIAFAYVGLTIWAASFQGGDTVRLILQWIAQSKAEAGGGYGDIQSGLVNAGFVRLAAIAPLPLLLAHGAWTYVHRRADIWVLLGVASIVARLWAYHRVYDDLLVIVGIVALFRLSRSTSSVRSRRWTSLLFGLAVAAMVAPARLELAPL